VFELARRKHPGQLFIDRPTLDHGSNSTLRSKAKLPFRATITAGGKSCEVEVHELGMRFVRWLERGTTLGT
jgi:hypothetical protein